ncbi:hypothetical protein G5C51_11760 [Streptomyces sp. A7024]|uniref:Uncharacterized protein n=1 Tax=Streptomyces coryli TaxID=1128680 RepID=A0A6G4TYQ1_9ACTN|nr:hypothetical protein [Streptomyces coryli]NGN64576.1 hypothetical protein [Streptomyces coryli]
MAKHSTTSTPIPDTVWLGRGRHAGPEPELDARRNLIALKAAGVLDDYVELDPVEAARSSALYPRDESADPGPSARLVFEARWRVDEDVTVRAQLTTFAPGHRRKDAQGIGWVLAAEAERTWQPHWPSPATMFWPDSDLVPWDHDTAPGLRVRAANHLPKDDDELRALLRECAQDGWYIHVLVHEAMTPEAAGQQPVTRFLPPSLRHRVVEHRADPEQVNTADFAAKKELKVRMPRGGAVVLPGSPQPRGYEAERFSVRNVFLDGSEPTELINRIQDYAALPLPLPADAEPALARLRQGWHLLTPDEELAHAKAMVERYAAELEAMTKSRDQYRAAAESAQAALPAGTSVDGGPKPSALAPIKALGRFRNK